MEISRQVKASQPAFRYGQGFFTTTRVKNFKPLWLPEHMQRLDCSLRDFHMAAFNEAALLQAASRFPAENRLEDGFLRILVWEEAGQPQFHLEGGPLAETSAGLKLMTSRIIRHSSEPLLKYKSFNYWNNQLAYQEALENDCDEAIFLNEKGEITECSRNNLFWIKDETLFTPQLDCGLLAGIARSKTIAIARKQGIVIKQGRFRLEDLQVAETVFLTNSVHGIRAAAAVNFQSYHANQLFGRLLEGYTQQAHKSLIRE